MKRVRPVGQCTGRDAQDCVVERVASDRWSVGRVTVGGRSSVVEFQPSKLAVVGSNPIARSKYSVLDRGCGQSVRGWTKTVSSGPT